MKKVTVRLASVHSTFAASPINHRIISNCGVNICVCSVPCLGTPQEYGDHSGKPYGTVIHAVITVHKITLHKITLHRLCHDGPASAPQRGARADLDLPAHAVAAGRLQLSASADLLGLWGRGDRALWTMGWRMDDTGATLALPALGHVGHRQCAAGNARRRALVSAVALRPLAWRQRALILLRRFRANVHCWRAGNCGRTAALV